MVDKSHTLYTKDDFINPADFKSKLFDVVVNGGLSVCKVCGEYEAGLDRPCPEVMEELREKRESLGKDLHKEPRCSVCEFKVHQWDPTPGAIFDRCRKTPVEGQFFGSCERNAKRDCPDYKQTITAWTTPVQPDDPNRPWF